MGSSDSNFWACGRDGNGRRRIEDYALIGDSETAALVSRTGSIDWLCWPRFDSEASLCALLGDGSNGYWRIAPVGEVKQTRRRYRGDTLILEQLVETKSGSILLTDLMPLRGQQSDLVRIVEGKSGCVDIRSVLDLRFEYGRLRPLLRRVQEHEISALAGPHAVVLRCDHRLDADRDSICCDFTLREGERASFVLTYFPSHCDVPEPVDPAKALQETEKYWSDWASKCNYQGPYRAPVLRSIVTLKALTFRPTGGTVAAATSSLPETPGGQRNWDYRYCWLRDAAFMLLAFMHSGYPEEARAWRDWLLRAVAGEPDNVRPLYAVDGDRGLFEIEADWLDGFNGATPVRFGNGAHDQLQLDVFGEVIDSFHLARRHGLDPEEESWELQRRMLCALEERWREPDSGFWEVRSEPQHFVHSKALAWAALDRAVRTFGDHTEKTCIERWAKCRDEIRREVMDKGVDRQRNCFVRAYGSSDLDAAALMLPLIGFVKPCDPIAVGTVEAIERELMCDGLVRRYDPEVADDGLPGSEGVFLACSFWLVDNYHLQGRSDDAHALFERLVGLANDVGLLSEEYSTKQDRLLGNFPQALSHVALVNSAYNLSEAQGPAEDRLSLHD
jgi:GH15 family glucan-1,4-alpha-glucosidase